MMIEIEQLLDAATVRRMRERLADAPWADGR